MKSRFFAGAVLAGLLVSGTVWADTDCNVPVAEWQSREALRQQLELQGVQVQRIKVDDGCYEVRARQPLQSQICARHPAHAENKNQGRPARRRATPGQKGFQVKKAVLCANGNISFAYFLKYRRLKQPFMLHSENTFIKAFLEY